MQKQLDAALRRLQSTAITNPVSTQGHICELIADDDSSAIEIVKVTQGNTPNKDNNLSDDESKSEEEQSEDSNNDQDSQLE